MVDSSQNFSKSLPDPELLRRVLASSEGQTLIQMLQSDGGAAVRKAVSALQTGNAEMAKAALTPLLAGTDAEDLSKRLEGKL